MPKRPRRPRPSRLEDQRSDTAERRRTRRVRRLKCSAAALHFVVIIGRVMRRFQDLANAEGRPLPARFFLVRQDRRPRFILCARTGREAELFAELMHGEPGHEYHAIEWFAAPFSDLWEAAAFAYSEDTGEDYDPAPWRTVHQPRAKLPRGEAAPARPRPRRKRPKRNDSNDTERG